MIYFYATTVFLLLLFVACGIEEKLNFESINKAALGKVYFKTNCVQ